MPKAPPPVIEDDCTIANPIPPSEVARYSPSRDPDSEQDIARYVEYESQQHVEHVELIKTEYVHGTEYEIWDVVTTDDRWWALTNLTNLYSQKHFPSLDYTISFHIGLMMRMSDSPFQREARGVHPFEAVYRRHEQAGEHLDRAAEVHDYQAVGMELRECLLSMVTPMMASLSIEATDVPKLAYFKAWADLFVNDRRAGSSVKDMRSYLKSSAEKTWTLVNWLTHYRNADQVNTAITFSACGTLIGDFAQLYNETKSSPTLTCPECGSKKVRTHYDVRISSENKSYDTCGVCAWNTHPLGEERSFETSALDLLRADSTAPDE